MRMPAQQLPPSSSLPSGPLWIGAGLLLMLVGAVFPDGPIVTAIALIALGTTEVVVSRQAKSPASAGIVLLHSTTYAMLYVLFVGARLHTPGATSASLTPFTALDLAVSTIPMAIACRRVVACIRGSVLSRH